MLQLILLVDYRDHFYSSRLASNLSMDVPRIVVNLSNCGICARVLRYADVDLRKGDYEGIPILYQSSQDPDLRYKGYIEDILFGLSLRGGILIPDFTKFRAHHNKVFMEVLRQCTQNAHVQSLNSEVFGTLEEYKTKTSDNAVVMKPSEGFQSKGIQMIEGRENQLKYARRVSSSFSFCNIRWKIESLLYHTPYIPMSMNRRKFVIQEYVRGLLSDYKIVIYGNRYYVLERLNTQGKFGASGGKNRSFPKELPAGLLDFAANCFDAFKVPFASFDIGSKDGDFFLFEFQFVCFGQYTVEMADFCFQRVSPPTKWTIVHGPFEAEKELAEAVAWFLNNHHQKEKE
jgi:hypothetical protein